MSRTGPRAPSRRRVAGRAPVALLLALLAGPGVADTDTSRARPAPPPEDAPRASALAVQARVMGMADEYGAALGEAMYLLVRSPEIDARGRWLAQSFLRNGMGAAIDIAVGSNPNVAVLDLLVLAALQSWALERHWIPAGIAETPGRAALERLRRAETELWRSGARFLDAGQLATLRSLVQQWIEAHPDRTVVSLVRFAEFTDQRRLPTVARDAASGLLADVESASAAVEDVTLLGERLLWFAGRLPYVLGQQAELTAYRMADQPEAALARASMESVASLAAALTQRLDSLDDDLAVQQRLFFEQLRAERAAALEDLAGRVNAERKSTVDYAMDRLARERAELLDDIGERQTQMIPVMTSLRDVIRSTNDLASELTGTVQALDPLVARFERTSDDDGPGLDFDQLREAANAVGGAAERLTGMFARADEALGATVWDTRIERLEALSDDFADKLFWRAAALLGILLAGLALLRLVPARVRTS